MDWLKCNICFNTYNGSILRPRSLTCGHTFCERCLNNTIQNETLTCPQCRKIDELNSVLDLPINFIVEGLAKSLNTCSQDINDEAISSPIQENSDKDKKSEAHGSLKSLLDQQEKSLPAQKELLKTSAGLCNDHPSKECMFRCSLHMCWVCNQCIEDQGDHPKHKCKITSFKEEIEVRRQEHKRSLEEERKSCDETSSVIEKHISYLKKEKEHHISLVIILQDLVKLHNKEGENLENEIVYFQNVIEKGKILKQSLQNVEATVLNTLTLDESNATRNLVKNKKAKARSWVITSKSKVYDGKLKMENSTFFTMATEKSLEYRETFGLLQGEIQKNIKESGQIENLPNRNKSENIQFTREVYIRESNTRSVLQEVHEDDIPLELIDQLQKEKRIKMVLGKKQNEAHLYMCVQVVLEDAFNGHQGNDLYDPDKVNYRSFRVKKTATLQEFLEQVTDTLKYPVKQIRLWPFNLRTNLTIRPTLLDLETELHAPLIEISDNSNPWSVFIETVPPDSGLRALQTFDNNSDVLLFFKYYDPRHKRLHYCGHHYIHVSSNVQELVPLLNERAGLAQGTELALFEEVNPKLLEQLTDIDRPLEEVIDELMDGDIIVFQLADLLDEHSLELRSCQDYFRDLYGSL